ncbi:uncharacterized protein [Rutidosis leptorrhynchoides]|uniref:uncharacterized protein n=1 Tax=Rutidosis leptorrhynchoides TaxID=125765 RepID=UPI003A98FA98
MKDIAATKLERNSKIVKLNIVCSDGISIDAELFYNESKLVQAGYQNDVGFIEVESNSKIIHMVEIYCAIRAKIENHYAPYHFTLDVDFDKEEEDYDKLQQKLNSYNSNFRQRNQVYALDLMIAAFDLEIKSLIDWMMKDIDDIFMKMTSDDEVYKFFFVNLNEEYNLHKLEFEDLVEDLENYWWAFKKADNWDHELLKVPFREYKTLPYEQRLVYYTIILLFWYFFFTTMANNTFPF